MAISIKDVQAGKFFVCGTRVREIAGEAAEEDIVYYTYLLQTGDPLYETPDTCSRRQIVRIAEREATPMEIARMKTKEARNSEESERFRIVRAILARISDERLMEEVKRRGLL